MKLLIHFLLISCLLIMVAETLPSTDEIKEIIKGGQSYITGWPPRANLKLLKKGEVYRHDNVLVWKGTFNDNTYVAIKIFDSENEFKHEKRVYKRLNATDDPDIEKNGVARVYYYGKIFDNYFAIARTWCDETLEHRFNLENGNFSEPTILLIFKQTVQALRYIHSKNVVVWDFRLSTIFIRGQNIFIGDLGMSKLNELDMRLLDYDSLLVWIWHMVGVPPRMNFRVATENDAKVPYLKHRNVREAFQFIVNIDGIDSEFGTLPDYDEIIRKADDTLNKISEESSQQVQFDWLREGSSGASSSQQ